MRNKIIIAVLIVLSVIVHVSINGCSKDAYKANSGLTMRI